MEGKYLLDGITVTDDRLMQFVKQPWPAALSGIPLVGPKSVEALRIVGMATTAQLVGKVLSWDGDGKRTLDWLREVLPPKSKPKQVATVILYKLQASFAIRDCPDNWEEL